MEILEKKDLSDFDKQVQKYLNYFEVPGHEIQIKGSSQYENLHYRSDYDILIAINNDTSVQKLFLAIRDNITKIQKDPNTYFIEMKLQTKDNDKLRFYHGDSFSVSDFEKYFGKLDFIKVDIVMHVKDMFWEASCIYNLTNTGEKITLDSIVRNIKEDIEEYKKEGQYYKVLKRMFSIYVLYNNTGQIEFLIRVFNSELGKLYEKICNMKAIELVSEFYTDKDTEEKIHKSLNLLHEKKTNLSSKIKEYSKSLNARAKKIYTNMDQDIRYP